MEQHAVAASSPGTGDNAILDFGASITMFKNKEEAEGGTYGGDEHGVYMVETIKYIKRVCSVHVPF